MLSEGVEIWKIVHSNTQWWLKGKDGGKMGYKIREECVLFFKKKVKEESVFIWAEAIFSSYFQDFTFNTLISDSLMFYLGLSWLDILLWNVIWYICFHSFVFPIVKPSSVNSNSVGSLSSEISEMALIAPQILTVLLLILLFVTQESSYYLADRINFVHLTC